MHSDNVEHVYKKCWMSTGRNMSWKKWNWWKSTKTTGKQKKPIKGNKIKPMQKNETK